MALMAKEAASFLSSFVVFMEEEEAVNPFLLSFPLGVLEATLVADLGGMIFSELLKRLTKTNGGSSSSGVR